MTSLGEDWIYSIIDINLNKFQGGIFLKKKKVTHLKHFSLITQDPD